VSEAQEDVTAEVAAEGLDPLIGVTLDGRYRIVGGIGKGAMGKVYRAVQVGLNRAVALKVLDSNYGAGREESFRQRFLVEAALTAKLSHPNTVRIFDYGCSSDGIYYLAMEFLEGETLDRVLSKGPLGWRRVLSVGQQIARALREAHELGVVHRDLKPGNVMFLSADDDTDFVKVLDFGLVKSFVEGQELEGRAITQQGMLMGSPPYMAPEQGDKNRADPRSDIYSLGCMLFECLTGAPPYSGGAPLEIILKHVNDPVPAVKTPPKFEAIPEAMASIVTKCLQKSPMDRFQSMDEVLQAMSELASPVATPAFDTPLPPTPIAAPPAPGRNTTPLLIAGFIVALLVGVGGTALVLRKPGKPAESAKVLFHIETQPAGAQVVINKVIKGVTPLDLELTAIDGRAQAEVTLLKEGFLPLTVTAAGSGPRLELIQKLQQKQPEPPVADKPAPKGTDKPSPAEKAAAERAAAEKLAAERAAAEKLAAERAAAEKLAAERAATEKAAAAKAAAEKLAAEKAAAAKAAAEKAAAEKAAIDRAFQDPKPKPAPKPEALPLVTPVKAQPKPSPKKPPPAKPEKKPEEPVVDPLAPHTPPPANDLKRPK
jgi:predicted Ser/Thr protein kinase